MREAKSNADPAAAPRSGGPNPRDPDVGSQRGDRQTAADVPEFGTRIVASVIDGAIAFVLGFIPAVGPILGAAYLVTRDGFSFDFADGRSVGKHFMHLRTIRLNGRSMNLETSIRRNWMFGFGGVIALIALLPLGPFGWLLILPVSGAALALAVYEVYRALNDPQQRRFGDQMAGTRVVRDAATRSAS